MPLSWHVVLQYDDSGPYLSSHFKKIPLTSLKDIWAFLQSFPSTCMFAGPTCPCSCVTSASRGPTAPRRLRTAFHARACPGSTCSRASEWCRSSGKRYEIGEDGAETNTGEWEVNERVTDSCTLSAGAGVRARQRPVVDALDGRAGGEQESCSSGSGRGPKDALYWHPSGHTAQHSHPR